MSFSRLAAGSNMASSSQTKQQAVALSLATLPTNILVLSGWLQIWPQFAFSRVLDPRVEGGLLAAYRWPGFRDASAILSRVGIAWPDGELVAPLEIFSVSVHRELGYILLPSSQSSRYRVANRSRWFPHWAMTRHRRPIFNTILGT